MPDPGSGREPAALVDTVIEDARWRRCGIAALAERAAQAALEQAGRDPQAHEIGLLAADDARVGALNAEFRGKAQPTNVLSWPAGVDLAPVADGPVYLGDVALAFETCAAEAAAAGLSLEDHATHLVVHAVFHLLGQDHATEADAEAMEALEVKTLARLGVANPYSG